MKRTPRTLLLFLSCAASAILTAAQTAPPASPSASAEWTFAVSGDSRNCGDFVMPAIAARVHAEGDQFYWHLGDFRALHDADQDMSAMHGGNLSRDEYLAHAWEDFRTYQLASFGQTPVFLGRGNHENVHPYTREKYIEYFSDFLNRPEIAAQREADGKMAAPIGPWYHWTHNGVDFITLDNASHEEFSEEQMKWLRGVLDRDLAPGSGIHTIVAGMHEALPHSTGAEHAMDDWARGLQTGETVYHWLYDAQAAGLHVYYIASHSHYYSPNIFKTPYWKQYFSTVLPCMIIGLAGAHRYKLPRGADPEAREDIYGFVQGTVHADGSISFALRQLSEEDLLKNKWPAAPEAAIHECYTHNFD
jgi:hypothetical protein